MQRSNHDEHWATTVAVGIAFGLLATAPSLLAALDGRGSVLTGLLGLAVITTIVVACITFMTAMFRKRTPVAPAKRDIVPQAELPRIDTGAGTP